MMRKPKSPPPPLPVPLAPEGLSERARALWNERAPRRPEDLSRREFLAEALRQLDRADAFRLIVESEGATFTNAKTGMCHIHPAVKAEREARQAFSRMWKDLGYNASRPIRTNDPLGRMVSGWGDEEED